MADMVDVAEVRKRLIHTLEQIKRNAALRREASDRAVADYDRFLEATGVPVVRHLVMALRAEGHGFQLSTPAGSVRMTHERASDDFIELTLDRTRQPITVIGRISYRRGSRLVERDLPIREDKAVGDLTDEDLLTFLLSAIEPFVER